MADASDGYLRALAAAGVPIIGTPGADLLEGSADDDTIRGLAGDDTLIGGDGNDSLDGGRGADRMEGGDGDDVYFVENAGDRTVEARGGPAGGTDLVQVSIDWRLGANIENLRLHGAAVVGKGNGLDNLLVGNGGDNRLHGYAGADSLLGREGDDRMFGGAGDDTFHWGLDAGSQVWLGEGEALADDGADVIRGGAGSDTYVVPTVWQSDSMRLEEWTIANGVVADLAAGTVEHVDTGFLTDGLHSIENIRTGQGSDRIFGSAGANVIECGGGHNVVRASGGDDAIIGGASRNSESYFSGRFMEILDGGAGNDVIESGGSYWEQWGWRSYELGVTADKLIGGAGDDHLIGGKGGVVMTGGEGADRFEARCEVLLHLDSYEYMPRDALPSKVEITDFDPLEGDRIDLRVVATRAEFNSDGNLEFHRGPLPDWVGRAEVGFDEVGYRTVERGNGSIDTILTYRFVATWPGYSQEATKACEFRMVLKGYDGGLTEDWLAIL